MLPWSDARGAKAEALAELSKQSLGQVLCVSETGPWSGNGIQNNNLMALGYVSRPAIEVGTEQLGFAVSVVFELK